MYRLERAIGLFFFVVCVVFVVFVVQAVFPSTLHGSQQPSFRAGVDLVHIVATVTEKKDGLVDDLTADDFEIYEDGKKQTIKFFASGFGAGSGEPQTHLGVLLDVSESMGDDMAFSKTAAIKFLNTLIDAADITFVDFDTEIRGVRYGQADFPRLVERIRRQKASGWTALYDAIGVYLDGADDQRGRKVMLLYTDGGDTRSSLSRGDLMDLLKASDVTVYVIGELEHQPSSTKGEQRMILQQIADVTGGEAFFPMSARELDKIYDTVLAQLRAQYTIGYLSTNQKTDGSWRKVDVRVVRKDGHDYRLRSRKGYFAPGRSGSK